MEHDARIPRSSRPIAVEGDKSGDESYYSVSPLVTPGGIALSDSEKAEALADNLEAQFQLVTDPSVPAVIQNVDVALRSYLIILANEPNLTNPEEVQEAIRALKISKDPGPNGIPNRALKHLPQRAVPLLDLIFNAILITHRFPAVRKHARVISILKPGKDSALPSSYRLISLLDTIGKLFEKILLTRILHEGNVRGMLRNENFGFRPEHSTSLQLARLVERITKNFGGKMLTGAVFLDVAKVFDTVWIDGLLYKLILLKLLVLRSPYNLLLPPGSDVRSVFPDGHVISSRHAGRCGSGWVDLPCLLQSVCQRHAHTLAPRRVSPLRGRYGRHSHVSQAEAACQLPGVVSQ